jgi:hypothetical protein
LAHQNLIAARTSLQINTTSKDQAEAVSIWGKEFQRIKKLLAARGKISLDNTIINNT